MDSDYDFTHISSWSAPIFMTTDVYLIITMC